MYFPHDIFFQHDFEKIERFYPFYALESICQVTFEPSRWRFVYPIVACFFSNGMFGHYDIRVKSIRQIHICIW